MSHKVIEAKIVYPKGRRLHAKLVAVILENSGYKIVDLVEDGVDELQVVVNGTVIKESDIYGWLRLYNRQV